MFMRLASRIVVIAGCALLGLAAAGLAQELGPEFWVAPSAAEYVLAADEAGGFIVAWKAETNATKRVFARRFGANGAALGGAVTLGNADGGGPQSLAAASVGNGGFVVAWIRRLQGSDRILARRLGPAGIGRLKDFGAAVQGFGSGLALAGLGHGEWASAVAYARPVAPFGFGGIWLTLRSATGALERAVRVTKSGFTPALAADGPGALLAAYRTASPGDPETLRCQLRAADGRQLAATTVISTEGDITSSPLLAANGGGRFVVGWVQTQSLRLRFFEPAMKASAEAIDTGVEGGSAALAMDLSGSVLATASVAIEFSAAPIHGRRYDRQGEPVGDEFQIATGDGPPAVAALGQGRFVAVWRQEGALRARLVRWQGSDAGSVIP
jgi:hypothetical protein